MKSFGIHIDPSSLELEPFHQTRKAKIIAKCKLRNQQPKRKKNHSSCSWSVHRVALGLLHARGCSE
jgi:hypothetical protein